MSSYGFTNVTPMAAAKAVAPVDIKVIDNYAKTKDEPSVVVLNNKTCPLDQGELITYRCNEVDKVSSSQRIQNPTRVKNGIQYVVKVEEILRTTDADGKIISDEPVVAYVTFRHQKSGNITPALVEEALKRMLGALYKTDGNSRISDMMRSAIAPTTN